MIVYELLSYVPLFYVFGGAIAPLPPPLPPPQLGGAYASNAHLSIVDDWACLCGGPVNNARTFSSINVEEKLMIKSTLFDYYFAYKKSYYLKNGY